MRLSYNEAGFAVQLYLHDHRLVIAINPSLKTKAAVPHHGDPLLQATNRHTHLSEGSSSLGHSGQSMTIVMAMI